MSGAVGLGTNEFGFSNAPTEKLHRPLFWLKKLSNQPNGTSRWMMTGDVATLPPFWKRKLSDQAKERHPKRVTGDEARSNCFLVGTQWDHRIYFVMSSSLHDHLSSLCFGRLLLQLVREPKAGVYNVDYKRWVFLLKFLWIATGVVGNLYGHVYTQGVQLY